MKNDILYLCILFFHPVGIRTFLKHSHYLPLELLQPIVCCLNAYVGYCLTDKLHHTGVEQNSCVGLIGVATQTVSSLQYEIKALAN
jgi:hypothetical protein